MVWPVAKVYLFILLGLMISLVLGARTTSLGEMPDWSELDRFQKSITHHEFKVALETVYCPRPEWWAPWIRLELDRAKIRKASGSEDWYEFIFSPEEDNGSHARTVLSPQSLDGMVIGLDPGHIGGEWSEMERRHFSLDQDQPVKEGDLSLAVARELMPALQKLGAKPVLVRSAAEPVTKRRPEDFRQDALAWAGQSGIEDSNDSSVQEHLIQERQELLFYRVDEIHARADLINHSIRPDLVVCIHFNAAPWPDSDSHELVERNDHHVLVNGCYLGGELAYDDQRFELIWRLVNRWHIPEQGLAESLARSFSKNAGLVAFSYKGPNALKIGEVPGVWARNLLANRKYRCPVVFLEPYVANSLAVYPRIQNWLQGKRGGDDCLIKEYASAVLLGLQNHFTP